jgi:hypothetical protein
LLTDENPEIRTFLVNQNLGRLFDSTQELGSPALLGICLEDTNDFVALKRLFESFTNHVKHFKESTNANATQLPSNAVDTAIEEHTQIPSAFPGQDFYLTEIQVQMCYSQNFLGELITAKPYREHTDKNYSEKIFYFEPVNKFYDLLLVKKLAWQQHQAFKHLHDTLRVSSKA